MPRQGSACPRSGPAPWARRHRPSMAGGGYRGILAAVPTAQNLHSASRGGVYRKSQSEAAYGPTCLLNACA
ncbi:Nucleoid-structuring protein H-NS [Pseudomonas sp. IT-P294]